MRLFYIGRLRRPMSIRKEAGSWRVNLLFDLSQPLGVCFGAPKEPKATQGVSGSPLPGELLDLRRALLLAQHSRAVVGDIPPYTAGSVIRFAVELLNGFRPMLLIVGDIGTGIVTETVRIVIVSDSLRSRTYRHIRNVKSSPV